MRKEILNELEKIEKEHQVRILFACESGSRAWGFPSKDSDYDVRFIYVHKRDWYLKVFKKRDVIELPINDVLDISGWDLQKALKLARKSNAQIMEWVKSPIMYMKREKEFERYLEIVEQSFKSIAVFYHYMSITKTGLKAINKTKVRLKKYVYVLRSLLSAKWVVHHKEQPPILFEDLLNHYLPDGELRKEIDLILEKKKSGTEIDAMMKHEELNFYIETEFSSMEKEEPVAIGQPAQEEYDEFFLNILKLGEE